MSPKLKWLLGAAFATATVGYATMMIAPDTVASLAARATGQVDGASGRQARATAEAPPPAVTVVSATSRVVTAEAMVTGTLVARDEILVAPQIEGQRIEALLAEEGTMVAKGDVLARLVAENIDAQLAQNSAAIARAVAGIAQAQSAIAQAEARLKEAQNAYDRALPLSRQGHISTSTLETREAAARSASAALATARDGLGIALADKALAEAQRREISWRRANTEIRAPAAGLVSRRTARVGAMASAQGEALFRIIEDGAIELDAEVPETALAALRIGQKAVVTVAGGDTHPAMVRLVSPEVDRTTRLGRVRLSITNGNQLKIGGFAEARIVTAEDRAIAIVASAVMYDAAGAYVLVASSGHARQRRVTLGLSSGGYVAIRNGLSEGEAVVARAGTFLRDGDAVTPTATPTGRVSDAGDTSGRSSSARAVAKDN